MSSEIKRVVRKNPRSRIVTWELILLKLLLLAMVGVYLEHPVGSVAGRISLEQEGFGIQTYNIKDNKVYAMAFGPRGGASLERGVWINNDGTFRIDQLPKGEYQIKVRATGYATEYVNGLFVEDGKVSTIAKPVRMALVEPNLTIASDIRVFTTKEKPHLWVNASATKRVKIQIFKTDIMKMVKDQSLKKWGYEFGSNFDLYRNNTNKLMKPFAGQEPVAVLNRELSQDDTDSSRADFMLDKTLPAGDYVAFAQAEGFNASKNTNALSWFNVSDLGLIIKQAPEKTLVRAIDLNTLKPIAGTKITLSKGKDEGSALVLSAMTGADGFAECPLPPAVMSQSSLSLLVMGASGQNLAYGPMSYWRNASEKNKTYFYTDRPVYRLGQTVYFKGISRTQEPKGFRNPGKDVKLNIAIEDPNNEELFKGVLKTSDHGSFNGIYTIPADGKTGAYQINITYPDGTTANETFEVAQYRKPEYLVEVKPLLPRYVAGQKVTAKIRANYFFGAPVANATVKYTVYSSTDWSSRWNLKSRPEYYSFYDDWLEGDDAYYEDYGGDYIKEGTATLDANGEALVEVETKKADSVSDRPYSSEYNDKKYKIEAEVTDISRMTVVSAGTAKVSAGDFCLFVTPDTYVAKVGEKLQASVQAVDYDGKPVASQEVSVRLSRFPWDSSKDQYRGEEIVAETTGTTNAQGNLTSTFFCKDQFATDTYFITARAKDKSGNQIADQGSIWIASQNYPYVREGKSAQQEPLSVRLDKTIYKPGEVARIMISAPVNGKEGADAIVTIEGPTIYSRRIVPMTTTAQLVEIPLNESYAPNVFVSVALATKKHQFQTQEKMIKVSPANKFLNVDIQTDKKRYQPGETVNYTISAKQANGSPAKNVELSLGVVDESIYSIRPEFVEDIKKFFYAKRSNMVQTICSFPAQYSGGPDKIEPRVRKDFKDTAFWKAELTTDDKGVATAQVKLPDNLTTWRATVRGVTMGTEVGSAINKVISTQDVLVRLALPRFFSEGDKSAVTCIVHNYSEQEQNIKLSVNMSNQLKTTEPLTVNFKVAPEKAYRHSWPVNVDSPGSVLISVKAVGDTRGDAMEMRLPVRALGIPAFVAKSGVLTSASEEFKLPLNFDDKTQTNRAATLTMASSSIGPVLGSFDSLIDYPYGCTEQTMSKLMPSIVAFQLHKNLDMPISVEQKKKFNDVYKQSMQKLKDHHHADGGWGWWATDSSNLYLTSYVVEGLLLLKDCGFAVEPDLITTGKTWLEKNTLELQKQLHAPGLVPRSDNYREERTDLARALFAISLTGATPDKGVVTSMSADVNQLTPEALSYMTLALKTKNMDAQANIFYKRLLELSNQNGDMQDWDHTIKMASKFYGHKVTSAYVDYSYRFTGVETTALALRAVLAMDPGNSERTESIKRWLMLQRGKNGWENTKTTSEVFMALLKDDLVNRTKVETNFSLEGLLANKAFAHLNFDPQSRYAPETKIKLPTAGDTEIVLKKEGAGNLYYTFLQTFFKKLLPGQSTEEDALPKGLKVTRKFFRLQTVAKASTGVLHFKTIPIEGGKIKAGETVLMKVYIDTPVSVPYIIVESPLPSGSEVVNDHKEGALEGETTASPIEGDWGAPWWTHQDVLDDRIVFFGTTMPAGKSEFHTLLRMEMPGQVQLNPVNFEGMYTKNVRGYSMVDALSITE